MTTDLMGMRRIDLVGRDHYIQQILDTVAKAQKRGRAAFIYLEGAGGIGKTALLEEVRKRRQSVTGVLVAEQVVDLFHLDHQISHGFCEEVAKQFESREKEFAKFQEHMEEFHRKYDEGQNEEAGKVWVQAESEFLNAIGRISDQNQVWLFLDTAEVLHSNHADNHTERGAVGERTSAWMLRVLHKLANRRLVIFMAGRPPQNAGEGFYSSLRKKLHDWLVEDPIRLLPLDAEFCRAYLEEVAVSLDRNRGSGADRIRNYLKRYGHDALHRVTGGMPLYLAMVCDILKTGSSLPEGFYHPDGGDTKEEEREVLTRHFMDLRAPLGVTLRAMSVLHKGANASLLSRVMQIEEKDADQYLKAVENLTLVKRRQGDVDRPYFLHDEIYDLYSRNDLPIGEVEVVYSSIHAYYEGVLKKIDRDMLDHPHFLTRYQTRRRMAMIEGLHYAVWFSPWAGFAEYFSQSSNALSAHVLDWEALLDNEFHSTVAWLKRVHRFPEDLTTYIELDSGLREIERTSVKDKDAKKGTKKAHEMLVENELAVSAPPFSQAYWWYLRGMIGSQGQVQTSELSNPSIAFEQAAKLLRQKLPDPGLEKAVKVLNAFMENYRGYTARLSGRYQKAMKGYQKAAAVMRQFDLDGLSGVLINQAYAMSMLGFDRRARETAREAYEVAQKTNSLRDQVRALNVRSSVEMFSGDMTNAGQFARQALYLLKGLPDQPRLRALIYISMARINRYEWNQKLGEATGVARAMRHELLVEGLDYLEGGDGKVREFFDDNKAPNVGKGAIQYLEEESDFENLSLARNESGCLWREVAWYLGKTRKGEAEKTEQQRAGQIAQSRLEHAAGIADSAEEGWLQALKRQVHKVGGSPYYPTLALSNLAWHYHYQGQHGEKVEKICRLIEEVITGTFPEEYLWKDEPPKINPETADVMIWNVLGKMEMLRGYEALRSWRQSPATLEKAVWHIALAMEYNYLLGQTNFNMRRAEMGLENRIRQSEAWQKELLPKFYEAALSVVGQLHLPEGRHPRLLRWLEERYGGEDDWGVSGGDGS